MPARRSLRLSLEVQRRIRAGRKWWLDNRDKAPDAFDEDLHHALELIATTPGAGIVIKSSKAGLVRRVLLPRVGFHLYYRSAPRGQIVKVITLWPAHSGRMPRL